MALFTTSTDNYTRVIWLSSFIFICFEHYVKSELDMQFWPNMEQEVQIIRNSWLELAVGELLIIDLNTVVTENTV